MYNHNTPFFVTLQSLVGNKKRFYCHFVLRPTHHWTIQIMVIKLPQRQEGVSNVYIHISYNVIPCSVVYQRIWSTSHIALVQVLNWPSAAGSVSGVPAVAVSPSPVADASAAVSACTAGAVSHHCLRGLRLLDGEWLQERRGRRGIYWWAGRTQL